MLKKTIRHLFHLTWSSEMLLLCATLLALFLANSQFSDFYFAFPKKEVPLDLSFLGLVSSHHISFKFIIDDFLMVIFFFLVGLELKKEILIGELSSRAKLLLPVIAAFGGVIVPALIFCYINIDEAQNLKGFAIPCATDIAFVYAVIKIFGNKISNATKVFIITLAVVDDLIAIIIIAFFYTQNIQAFYLLYSFLVIFILFLINAKKSESILLYLILGLILWFLFLQANIHPTIAGIILAMFIPFKIKDRFFLTELAYKLAPFVSFVILPIFAFANSGVNIANFSPDIIFDVLVLGVVMGLFLGKQIGILLFSFVAIKLKICELPKDSRWLEFYGVAILAGIGFTMSLFIGNLAFDSEIFLDKVRLSVLLGSLISFIFGSFILLFVSKKRRIF